VREARVELHKLLSMPLLLGGAQFLTALARFLLASGGVGAVGSSSLPPRRKRHHGTEQSENQHVAAAKNEEQKR